MKKITQTFIKSALLSVILIILIDVNVYAQAVSINSTGAAPDASSVLDISAVDKGLLIPRVQLDDATTAAPVTSPADGLIIYNATGTEPKGLYVWDATDAQWKQLYNGTVPSVPGETEYWLRPASDPTYIYPEGNDRIKVYDAGQTYGLYYDGGTNQFGLYGRTTNITDPTAAVVGFSDVAGNQTYGYLGFNGTWSSPSYTTSYNFGSVNGAAVYGIVDDPGRIAGFFRTTTDASYAANIAYSDVWIAGYYYIDNYDDSYAARPAFYAQSVVSCDQSGFQSAVKGYSVMDTVSSNLGWTVGGSMIAIGEGYDTGAGQNAIGIYGYSETTPSLTSYGAYCRGDDTDYAKAENSAKSGVGIFSSGSLIGSLSYGEIYGMNVSGERYGLYVDGRQYTNDIITQLSDNGTSERTATYVPTSTSVDIITKGTATLSNGKAVIYFDKKFASTVSDKEPVIITVTPVGQTEGVYIQSAKSTGFVIAENNNGKSNSVVNWIAVGTKKGYEKPINAAEILDATYDKNLKDIMSFKFEENDFIQKSMYWDGSSLKFKETSKKGISDLNKPLSLGKIKN